jgi:hypothetical protein
VNTTIDLVTCIRGLVARYDEAVALFPASALAWHLIMQAPERPADYLAYHGNYFAVMNMRDMAREYLREALYTYETGRPVHTVWQAPLEDFDTLLARARAI